ncbi:MAG: hypothetical protein KGM15_11585 [Pseudomonadota bacterium]|nr:hypothetical protein [Pseudomonadota bacterium]
MKTLIILAMLTPFAAAAAEQLRAVDAPDATRALRARATCHLIADSQHLTGSAREDALKACLAKAEQRN